ncbi:NACHT domain-containing protein [Streptomyces sp. NPDC013187]|uniref:NACHT domain-containing protein n=1 Tax=Streptomyces sp. NPDC013187 TaxID=3364865 RepID=UPI003688CFD5
MRTHMSYRSAVQLLDGRNSKLLKLIDQATVALLGASAIPTHGATLALFGLRNEAIRLGREKITEIRDRRHRWSDPDRTDRLVAAHAILVITNYFEALTRSELPIDVEDLQLTDQEKVILSSPGALQESHGDLLRALTEEAVPVPTPARSHEAVLGDLRSFYGQLCERLITFIDGLAVVEQLTETDFDALRETIRSSVPEAAVRRYQEDFLKLAADCPVFALWANLNNHQATREAIRELNSETARRLSSMFSAIEGVAAGLSGVEILLSEARVGSHAYAATALAIRAASELEWPIVNARLLDAHPQVQFPKLREGYINPAGRITDQLSSDDLGDDSWWDGQPLHSTLEPSLAGLLTEAYDAPIVVLGQPGAGKSLLTKVLAARLSQAGILAIRVELRHVDANAPIERQIRNGIEQATNGEQTSWPELVRAYHQAKRRVVLLDGFDELLQATGVNRSDYLELVQNFQQNEAAFGRHTAILITSRTVVASRTRFPEGTVVLRLDPFTDDQISQSITTWNDINRPFYSKTRLKPIPMEVILRHRTLAEQPLLLLMLELYDADDNSLQKEKSDFDISDLYEKMLIRFSRREVMSRGGASKDSHALQRAIEQKLQQLSITAAAMFNRAQQWVNAVELEEDLSQLYPTQTEEVRDTLHEPLTKTDLTVGGFFFIHKSSAEGLTRRRTYEFMHATFGEYLMARGVWRSLEYLLATAQSQSRVFSITESPRRLNDDFLYALLSFEPLSAREPVVDFLRRCVERFSLEDRSELRKFLISLFRVSLFAQPRNDFAGYEPVRRRSTTARLAIYNANLLLLATLLEKSPVQSDDLFVGSEGDEPWVQHTRLWQSQFTTHDAWMGFVRILKVNRLWKDDRRVLEISAPDRRIEAPVTIGGDDGWPFTLPVTPEEPVVVKMYDGLDLLYEADFLSDPQAQLLLDIAEPMTGIDPEILSLTVVETDGRLLSPARALLELLAAISKNGKHEIREKVYRRCLPSIRFYESIDRPAYLTLILSLLSSDVEHISPEFTIAFCIEISSKCSHGHHKDEIAKLLRNIEPEAVERVEHALEGMRNQVNSGPQSSVVKET